MPTLLVWGKQDAITPLSLAEAMHGAASHSVLAVYGGCGHIAVVSCMDHRAGKRPTSSLFLFRIWLRVFDSLQSFFGTLVRRIEL
jgi:hypothetical protein